MTNRGQRADDLDLNDLDAGFDGGGFDDAPPPSNGGSGNRRFLFVAALLVALILIGVVLIILAALQQGELNRQTAETAAAIQQTNDAVALALTRTTIAKSFTPTPSSTPTPTDTPTSTSTPSPTATETPTASASPSPSATVDMASTFARQTQDAIIAALTLQPGELTGTAIAQQTMLAALTQTARALGQVSPTATGPTPTVQIIVLGTLTPIGTPGTPGTPATLDGGEATAGTAGPTLVPSPTQLGEFGFFDDVAGNASPANLPLIGLAALGLVAVIVIARRLRVRA